MNIYNECSNIQRNLFDKAGIIIENKEYTDDEIKAIENNLANYIINQSKNNIWKVRAEYDSIFSILNTK